MIITEFYSTREDGVSLYRTYSDAGYMIRQTQTGALYSEAVDIENSGYTYVETDQFPEDETISADEALAILMGGDAT